MASIKWKPVLIKPMASNHANTGISIDKNSPFSTSEKQVPAALTMMVDSMSSMIERAKIDLENVDQRARADLENIDQRARKDVALLDQRAREDIQKVDKKARRDIAILDKRARKDHELLLKIRQSKGVTS